MECSDEENGSCRNVAAVENADDPMDSKEDNQQLLQIARTSRPLLTTIRQGQLRYLGNVLRGSRLDKDCLLGTTEGEIATGRKRMMLMDGVKEVTRCTSIGENIRMSEARNKWRNIVASVNTQGTARR